MTPPLKPEAQHHINLMAQRVADLRHASGMSAYELAKLAGVNHSTVWKIEHGFNQHVPAATLYALCKVLGVSIDYLFGSEARITLMTTKTTCVCGREVELTFRG